MNNVKISEVLMIAIILTSFPSIDIFSNAKESSHSNIESSLVMEECVSVIVTGSYCKDGRAILLKNRDTTEEYNCPYYITPSDGLYSYTAINHFWMGMNERGLAVMNTAMPGGGYNNGVLNKNILKDYERVEDVWSDLKTSDSPIGADNRGDVSTCVGVIDRFGNGVYFEIDHEREWAIWVNNSFRGAANSWRHNGGDGGRRCRRVEDILTDIYDTNGVITWQDVVQVVSRDVEDKDKDDGCFILENYPCNDLTNAAFVAVSGDPRYEGKLNCFWAEYGNPPIVGLFTPLMEYYGNPPNILKNMTSYTSQKKAFAQEPCENGFYNSERVQEIQRYTFYAENYTFSKYDEFMEHIVENLSDEELKKEILDYINDVIELSSAAYISEKMDFPPYKPDRPSGKIAGDAKRIYNYTTKAIDYEGDQIFYYFDWGDNSTSGWTGPFTSGEIISASHSWNKGGNYSIRVMAKDSYDLKSSWSDPLPVSMPKTYDNPVWMLIERLFGWVEQMVEREILPRISNL